MHDFQSDDPDHLSFAKNEILEIIKEGDNGWWAAFRKGDRVGWIPGAFVNRLSGEVAEKLRNTREELRIYEYEAEQLYTSAPTQQIHHLYDSDSSPSTTWKRPPNQASPTSASEPSSRMQKSRDEASVSYVMRVPRTASSNALRYQEVPLSQNPDHPKSPPNHSRSFIKQQPIPVDERPMLPRLSTAKEPNYTNGESARTGLPDGLVKRSRSQKLKRAVGLVDPRSQPTVHPQPVVPWALQPAYPDQIRTDASGNIWGTLDVLVDKLTTDTPQKDSTQAADDTRYRNIFLMTFRTFTTADILFDMLVQRCRRERPENLTIVEWQNHTISIQRTVLTIFTMWLEEHRLLEEEPHIAQRMTGFLRLSVLPPLSTMAKQLMQTIERLPFATSADTSPKNTPRRCRKSPPHKNDLLRLYTADVAEQLTILEFKLYANVTPQECIRHANAPSTRSSSHLSVFCSTHDKLAAWVKTSILSNNALGKRANIIDFWIKVAEKCKQLNNFSSMSAVINALSSTVISRLPLTWVYVGRKPTLDGLLRHNDPTGGFSGYRNLLQNVDGSCVPFLGMYMTDLVHIQDQFSDENGQICFLQRQRWYETVVAMLRYQSKPYDITKNSSTLKFIEDHLREDSSNDQNWFWSRSQEIENLELSHADIRKGLEAVGF